MLFAMATRLLALTLLALTLAGGGAGAQTLDPASREALEIAIDSVRQLGRYIDPMLAAKLAAATEANPEPAQSPLSERELQILAAIARGKSSKEIARECSVSPKTICNHVSNIYAKLNLNHRGQLVLYAAEIGLTQPYPALSQSMS